MFKRKQIPDEWYRRVREIETLDPEQDAQRIVDLCTMDFGNTPAAAHPHASIEV